MPIWSQHYCPIQGVQALLKSNYKHVFDLEVDPEWDTFFNVIIIIIIFKFHTLIAHF